jgi:hypothetical protein
VPKLIEATKRFVEKLKDDYIRREVIYNLTTKIARHEDMANRMEKRGFSEGAKLLRAEAARCRQILLDVTCTRERQRS